MGDPAAGSGGMVGRVLLAVLPGAHPAGACSLWSCVVRAVARRTSAAPARDGRRVWREPDDFQWSRGRAM